jgi:hypothetical protein
MDAFSAWCICGEKTANGSHRRGCQVYMEDLLNRDLGEFKRFLARALEAQRKTGRNYGVIKFAQERGITCSRPELVPSTEAECENKALADILAATRQIELTLDFGNIPALSGIYILHAVIEGKRKVLYVGKADQSIQERWRYHHRAGEVRFLLTLGIKVYINCVVFPVPVGSGYIENLEAKLIRELSPILNGQKVSVSV